MLRWSSMPAWHSTINGFQFARGDFSRMEFMPKYLVCAWYPERWVCYQSELLALYQSFTELSWLTFAFAALSLCPGSLGLFHKRVWRGGVQTHPCQQTNNISPSLSPSDSSPRILWKKSARQHEQHRWGNEKKDNWEREKEKESSAARHPIIARIDGWPVPIILLRKSSGSEATNCALQKKKEKNIANWTGSIQSLSTHQEEKQETWSGVGLHPSPSHTGAWWCLVVLGGAWCLVLGGAWWCLVVLGGAWWCLVVLGGAWWCLVVLGGVLSCVFMLPALFFLSWLCSVVNQTSQILWDTWIGQQNNKTEHPLRSCWRNIPSLRSFCAPAFLYQLRPPLCIICSPTRNVGSFCILCLSSRHICL